MIQEFSMLLCDGVEDARMTFIKEQEVRWYENLSRADECSF